MSLTPEGGHRLHAHSAEFMAPIAPDEPVQTHLECRRHQWFHDKTRAAQESVNPSGLFCVNSPENALLTAARKRQRPLE